MDTTALAFSVAGRAVVAYLQGCRLTALAVAADRSPWQQVEYEPPASFDVKMFDRGSDGALRPTTEQERQADALRQARRLRAVAFAAGPVALALRGRDATPAASRPPHEDRWFVSLALELEPEATPDRIRLLYEQVAARARRLLEKPKSWSAVEEVARALAIQGRLSGEEAVGAILVGRGSRAPRSAPEVAAPLAVYRARLRRGRGRRPDRASRRTDPLRSRRGQPDSGQGR